MMTVDYPLNKLTAPSVVAPLLCLDITVAIPTYNGAARIPEVLDQLKQQSGTEGLTWEVIVCDNNSCDRTADIVEDYQQAWLKDVPLRYCFVAEQGAAFARQRAVMEARGHIVAFLDDDNIPARNWLSNVQRFAKAYPRAGAFGSQIHGNFQGELPEGFDQIACFLAIVERGGKPHLYRPESKILPPAAGLAVRRAAWLEAVPSRLFLNHKGKAAGLASEDLEAMLHIQKAGWDVWYNSDMVVTHQIPHQRLQQDYLVALMRCVGLSRFYIRWLGAKDWRRFFKVPAYIANDLRKLALHYLKNGLRQNTLNTVAACERSLLISTLVSPAFLLKKAYEDFWQTHWDDTQLPERQRWLQSLTDAFEGRQLELYQQAIVCLAPSTTSKRYLATPSQYEILVRLCYGSSDDSLAVPASFFPTAERYGLMRTIDRQVIRQICKRLDSLATNAVYSINLSAASVCDPSLVAFLEEQLSRYRLQPESLCFEVQASVIINSFAVAKTLITRLKALGLQVAIDEITQDAGRLDQLTQSSIDCFKLSPTMLAVDRSQVSAWVELSQQRGAQLVAKGVETQQVVEQLQALGVRYFQGYHLSKPAALV